MSDLISREDAKRKVYLLGKNPSINEIWDCLDALPSAEPKGANLINRHDATTVIREECLKCNDLTNADLLGRILALPTSRQTDCTEFIMWLIEVVLDEEDWELNAVGYGETIARKLKKLGLLEVKDGYYIRPSADRPQVNSAEWVAEKEREFEELNRPKEDSKPQPYIPEASTERVVHCKDCVYSRQPEGEELFVCENRFGMSGWVREDEFCSSGSL